MIIGDLNLNTDAKYPTPRPLHALLTQRDLQQRVSFITRPPR